MVDFGEEDDAGEAGVWVAVDGGGEEEDAHGAWLATGACWDVDVGFCDEHCGWREVG